MSKVYANLLPLTSKQRSVAEVALQRLHVSAAGILVWNVDAPFVPGENAGRLKPGKMIGFPFMATHVSSIPVPNGHLAFLIHNGRWAEGSLVHLNGNALDLCKENLVDQAEDPDVLSRATPCYNTYKKKDVGTSAQRDEILEQLEQLNKKLDLILERPVPITDSSLCNPEPQSSSDR